MSIMTVRSPRSDRVATLLMPFNMTGRTTSNSFSASSEYNARVAKPPPVASVHITSDSEPDKHDRLSRQNTHEFVAAIMTSRSPFGGRRSGDLFGSISFRTNRQRELLAAPFSPATHSTGYGPRGRSAAMIHASNNIQESSSGTFTNVRSSSIDPP
ncbi:MAG: hypothetical protein ACE5EX_09880 [Phycisphaerae bacterium]